MVERDPVVTPSSAPVAYVAGPLTTYGDVAENRARAVQAAKVLAQQGFTLVVPHFFLELDAPPLPYDYWMGACLALLARCDIAFFLPGWQASTGCRIEHAFCREHDIRVIYLDTMQLDGSTQEASEQPPSTQTT